MQGGTYILKRPLLDVVLIMLPILPVGLDTDLARSGRNAALTKYIDVAFVRKAINLLIHDLQPYRGE